MSAVVFFHFLFEYLTASFFYDPCGHVVLDSYVEVFVVHADEFCSVFYSYEHRLFAYGFFYYCVPKVGSFRR